MIIGEEIIKLFGDEGRRFLTDRRKFSYTAHVPERRSEENRRSGTDRRKDHRYLAKNPTFVTIWTEHKKDFAEKDGQLLNISNGGMALRCTATPEESKDYSLLEVFLPGYENNIDNIPFKIISNIEITSDSASNGLTLRRYGLQFKELTPHQSDKLNHFLLNYTSGKA